LLKNNHPVAVNAYDGLWLDIGRPDDYIQAIETFDMMKEKILYE
jgi:NDP-sugar pyrophosphorylase family protein